MKRCLRLLLLPVVFAPPFCLPAPPDEARAAVTPIVSQIQRADYEGDRARLKVLYDELAPFATNKELTPRLHYWRGFAMWRRAINGFNDSVDPRELEQDLQNALTEFKEVRPDEPGFGDARIAMVSCLGNLIYIHSKDAARVQELLGEIAPLAREAKAAAPDNPRLYWVMGPNLFITPVERGGGQDKALQLYAKGLDLARKSKGAASDPLEPSWGEAELLMNIAWSNLNKTTPDLNEAERNARRALALVPHWHYVRDILLPQIVAAKAKAKAGEASQNH